MTLATEIIKTAEDTQYTIIWLHGLGADGHDFVPLVPELKLPKSPGIKFIFPHAPIRPITLNNGYEMRAWFDMFSLDRDTNANEDDILTTVGWIKQLIDNEIKTGTPADKILLAGFSQGGVIAIQTALRYPEKLAGVMILSSYIPFEENLFKLVDEKHKGLAVFAAHGISDPVIPFKSWEDYTPKLEAIGLDVDAHAYPMEHSVSAEEIKDISAWLQKIVSK